MPSYYKMPEEIYRVNPRSFDSLPRTVMQAPHLIRPHFLSWSDLVQANLVTTEENSIQYCIDTGILRNRRLCPTCQQWMNLVACPTRKYKDGCCWRCPTGDHFASVRADSILLGQEITAGKFIHLLWLYCTFSSVNHAAGL